MSNDQQVASEKLFGAIDAKAAPTSGVAPPGDIPSCCVATIKRHVQFNPMMVCAECKNIIKCFLDDKAYDKYLTFCQSRRRPILKGKVQDYWTIAFRSYDTYGR